MELETVNKLYLELSQFATGGEMTPEAMARDAAAAMQAGTKMTLLRRRGAKMPPKFPRGELLCENHDGRKVYSYDPMLVLAWLSAN